MSILTRFKHVFVYTFAHVAVGVQLMSNVNLWSIRAVSYRVTPEACEVCKRPVSYVGMWFNKDTKERCICAVEMVK